MPRPSGSGPGYWRLDTTLDLVDGKAVQAIAHRPWTFTKPTGLSSVGLQVFEERSKCSSCDLGGRYPPELDEPPEGVDIIADVRASMAQDPELAAEVEQLVEQAKPIIAQARTLAALRQTLRVTQSERAQCLGVSRSRPSPRSSTASTQPCESRPCSDTSTPWA